MAPESRQRAVHARPDAQGDGELTRGARLSGKDSERNAPVLAGEGISAYLYDADGEDHEVALDPGVLEGLADADLLWVDVDSSQEGAIEALNAVMPVKDRSLLPDAERKPFIHDFGDSFVLGVLTLPPDPSEVESGTGMLTCAVGHNWLVTVHSGEITSLQGFADHLRGDSAQGRLDAPSFLARLLEWVVNAYLDHLDGLQDAIDDLEETVLRGQAGNDAVGQLVELRHDIGRLRRRLSPHRQIFATLAHPSFDVISGSSASRDFGILVDRLEMAVQAVDSTREMIVGAFDVFMTQTAQRTNNIMRVLTIVSLTLLPATLIAGILGMNMLPKFLLHPWVAGAALVLMLAVAGGLLVTMRLRRWL